VVPLIELVWVTGVGVATGDGTAVGCGVAVLAGVAVGWGEAVGWGVAVGWGEGLAGDVAVGWAVVVATTAINAEAGNDVLDSCCRGSAPITRREPTAASKAAERASSIRADRRDRLSRI
jgi:hypothetical protein